MSQRDRQAVLAGVLALVVVLGYFYGWQPLHHKQQLLMNKVSAQQQTLAWMQAASAQVRQAEQNAPKAGGAPAPGSLLSAIEQALRGAPLEKTEKRLEPATENRVHVSFNQVEFDELSRWLALLQDQFDTRVEAVSVERLPEAGMVKARITLAR